MTKSVLVLAIACIYAVQAGLVSEIVGAVNELNIGWTAKLYPQFERISPETAQVYLGLSSTPVSEEQPRVSKRQAKLIIGKSSTIPAAYDFRRSWPVCSQPIRDQQSCGGCWSFSANSVFGARYCRASIGLANPVMAPQYAISCDSDSNGCNGGTLSRAWNFFLKNGNVEETTYPFTSGDGSVADCMLTGKRVRKFRVTSFTRPASEQEMQIEIMTNGPITVGMNVYMDLFTYEDGIYSHVTGDFAGGHAVYIVGWGEREGVKYWIVVNSWSDAWAQNGTFKILRGQNECGIETGYKPVAPKIEVVTN